MEGVGGGDLGGAGGFLDLRPMRTLWQVAESTAVPPVLFQCQVRKKIWYHIPGTVLRFTSSPSLPHVHWRAYFYLCPVSLTEQAPRKYLPLPGTGGQSEGRRLLLPSGSFHQTGSGAGGWKAVTCGQVSPPPIFVRKLLSEHSHAGLLLHCPGLCSLCDGRGEQLWQKLLSRQV